MLIRYEQSTANVLLGLAGLLLAAVCYAGIRNQQARLGASMLGVVLAVAGVVAVILGAEAASWLISAMQERFPRIHAGLMYHSGVYILGFSALGMACAAAIYSWASKRIGAGNLALGGLAVWFSLTLAVSIYFRGGSYLFLWPLLFSLLGWCAFFGWKNASLNARSIVLAVSGIPAIVLVVPMVHKLWFALAGQSVVIVSALLGLILPLLLGKCAPLTMSRRWLMPLGLGAAGAGLLVAAIAMSGVDQEQPAHRGMAVNLPRH